MKHMIALLLGLSFSLTGVSATADPQVPAASPAGTSKPSIPGPIKGTAEGQEKVQERSPWGTCASPNSKLTIENGGGAHHDTTTFRLVMKDGRKQAGEETGGIWGCLAYSQPTATYVLGMISDAQRPLLSISYLNEKTGASTSTRAIPVPDDPANEWHAFASVPSDDGRFIALVTNRGHDNLAVLNTTTDCLMSIGRAPSPPPSAKQDTSKNFEWGAIGLNGFVGMDPGILSWRDHVLTASLGRDEPTKRAASRKQKSWDVDKLTQSCVPPPRLPRP